MFPTRSFPSFVAIVSLFLCITPCIVTGVSLKSSKANNKDENTCVCRVQREDAQDHDRFFGSPKEICTNKRADGSRYCEEHRGKEAKDRRESVGILGAMGLILIFVHFELAVLLVLFIVYGVTVAT